MNKEKVKKIAYWVIFIYYILIAVISLVFGGVFCALLALAVVVLMMPLKSWQALLNAQIEKKVKCVIIVVLAVLCLCTYPTQVKLPMEPESSVTSATSMQTTVKSTDSSKPTVTTASAATGESKTTTQTTAIATTKETVVTTTTVATTVTTKSTTTTVPTTTTTTTTKATTTTQTTEETSSQTVYRTPSGKRYHLDPDCGGKNSYEVTLDKAENAGLTPCKKCAN